MSTVSLKMQDKRPLKKRYWLTPPDLMASLQAEFAFDFDACPHPRPEGFDGLKMPWGKSTWVNPPFTGISWVKWAEKAVSEQLLGKQVVLIMPHFATRAITILCAAGAEWRVFGELRWLAIEDGTTNPAKLVYPAFLAILRPGA